MNPVLDCLRTRKSVRAFTTEPVSPEARDLILDAAVQAPTAGNQMLYTILDIRDREIRERLAVLCDHQPFIAKAPLAFVFLADCRRWYDTYRLAGAAPRKPGAGDLVLACEDALVAAQNTVIAAWSLGIGSCYIGDIIEHRETMVELLKLDRYVFPVAMVVYGYPDEAQKRRPANPRFPKRYVVRTDTYARSTEEEIRSMFREQMAGREFDFGEYVRAFCARKYMSEFSQEMTRSARAYMDAFLADGDGPDSPFPDGGD